jgi:hypothetical protein
MPAEDCQKAGFDSLLMHLFADGRGDLIGELASGLGFESMC